MKKTLIIARIIYWTGIWLLIGTLIAAGLEYQHLPDNKEDIFILMCLLWVSALLIFIGFTIMEKVLLIAKPEIKPNCLYMIEKIIAHNYRNHTAVLNREGNVELFHCRFVHDIESLQTGKYYTVKKIDGDLFFTLS